MSTFTVLVICRPKNIHDLKEIWCPLVREQYNVQYVVRYAKRPQVDKYGSDRIWWRYSVLVVKDDVADYFSEQNYYYNFL
jgi:hypothetical protein